VLNLEPAPALSDFVTKRAVAPLQQGDVIFTGSGKAALRLVFQHLRMRGVLENKMSPIMVPAWLGTWVYATLLPFGFPVQEASNAKVALPYHQYGFPQDMDRVRDIARTRGITLVEDCAHACASSYGGAALGSFGEYAVYSFSKFAFCFALGGVRGTSEGFERYVQDQISRSGRLLRWSLNGFKYLDEANAHRARPSYPRFMDGLRNMAYARYPDQAAPGRRVVQLWRSKRDGELTARRANYQQLRISAGRWGLCDHLEPDNVVPYAVPLNVSGEKAQALMALLSQRGITAANNRFDFARCLFEPDYRPTVLVPIHSQMSGSGMERLCDSLEKVL
jgi:hypothetical protein